MNKQTTFGVNGRIVFWSLGNDSEFKALEEGFENLDLAQYIPAEQSVLMSLKSALVEVYGSRRCLVRKLESPRKGFQVVQEISSGENKSGLDYNKLFSVELDVGPGDGISFMDPDTGDLIPDPTHAHSVRDLFWRELDKVPRDNVARSLKAIVSREANGICLRETGGIYWVPQDSLALWDKVVSVVEGASPSRRNKIYGPRTLMDDNLVNMAMDWLAQNVESEMGQIRERLSKAKTKRGKTTQNDAAADLQAKVQHYESIFNKTLTNLKDSTKDLKSARVLTALSRLGSVA